MEHTVTFTIPGYKVTKADIEFNVSYGGTYVGKLRISKGAIVWFRGKQRMGHKLLWRKFDEVMAKHAPFADGPAEELL